MAAVNPIDTSPFSMPYQLKESGDRAQSSSEIVRKPWEEDGIEGHITLLMENDRLQADLCPISGDPKTITEIFISNVGKSSDGQGQFPVSEREKILDQLNKSIGSPNQNIRMFLQFDEGSPILTIQKNNALEDVELKEKEGEEIGKTFAALAFLKSATPLSILYPRNPGEDHTLEVSAFIKDGSLQLNLVGTENNRTYVLTMHSLEFILQQDLLGNPPKRKQFPLHRLSEAHQRTLAGYILSGDIHTVIGMPNSKEYSADLFFLVRENELNCPKDLLEILRSYEMPAVSETAWIFDSNMITGIDAFLREEG